MPSNAELIKERLGITEVVGSYLKLEKAGANFKARCPFHNEKTPSFFVSPTRNSFYCFGCEAKGDIFSFVERYEGVDFRGALKILAERAGVELTREDPRGRDERESLFSLLESATNYFARNLKTHSEARQYLLERGLTEATLEEFRLGYSLPEWRALSDYLISKGFSEPLIEKSGLGKRVSEGGNRLYDRFRGRIMFPIKDTSGRVVAFSGRIFDIPKTEETPAKYINSPETPLFSKSKILYGLHRAKEAIRKLNFIIVVEGQMDLLMSHQAGYRNTVALSGTALTEEQVEQLLRFSKRLVLALDTDSAGVAATGRSASLALGKGMDVKVARLSGGKDPADLILADPELWREAVRKAVHIVEYYLSVVLARESDPRKRQLEVSSLVLPYIALIESPMDKEHFISRVAHSLRLSEEAVRKEVEKLRLSTASSMGEKPSAGDSRERILPREQVLLQDILGILWWLEGKGERAEEVADLRARLKTLLPSVESYEQEASLRERLVFKAELLYAQTEELSRVLAHLFLHLERELLRQSIEKLRFELAEAESKGNSVNTELLWESRAAAARLSEIERDLQT